MKTCSACGAAGGPENFYADASRKDGLTHACRLCHKARSTAYRANNQAKVKAYRAKRRKTRRIKPLKAALPTKIIFTAEGTFLRVNGELILL